MAKNSRSANRWSLPPEGLWVSPTGKMESVNEHLMAIAERPDLFGLSPNEVKGADELALRAIAERLITQGWTRFRYLDGKYLFEVDNAPRRARIIEDILQAANAIPQEEIHITQFDPRMEYVGTVDQLYERTLFRFASKKLTCKWAFFYGR